jgi:uncharacterized protein (UPF0216 family)
MSQNPNEVRNSLLLFLKHTVETIAEDARLALPIVSEISKQISRAIVLEGIAFFFVIIFFNFHI